jgi:Collagen triple helix repeat (20 copies)
MLSPLRNRFGIPGVISVIALVFAMIGGAYAATNNSGGGKATASAKAKKGPRGARGPQGPAGPVGPAGPAGAKGDAGAAGANGTNGKDGAQGPTGKTGPTGEEGPEGPEGPEGEKGEPWTVGGTLPSKATETGVWSMGGYTVEALSSNPGTPFNVPIPFSIPLADDLEGEGVVHYLKAGESGGENCPGSPQEPKAKGWIQLVLATPEHGGV